MFCIINPAICASFLTLLVQCYTCSGERWAENRTTEEEERRAEEGAGAPPRTDGCQAHHPQVRKELGLPSSDDPDSPTSGEQGAKLISLKREMSQAYNPQVRSRPDPHHPHVRNETESPPQVRSVPLSPPSDEECPGSPPRGEESAKFTTLRVKRSQTRNHTFRWLLRHARQLAKRNNYFCPRGQQPQ
jgi:hypothetical protein